MLEIAEIRLGPLQSQQDLATAAQELADKENEVIRNLLDLAGKEVTWDDVQGKPEVFPPDSSLLSLVPETVILNWEDIQEKPLVFPPAAHKHTWTDILNPPPVVLEDDPRLSDARAPTAHDHTWEALALADPDWMLPWQDEVERDTLTLGEGLVALVAGNYNELMGVDGVSRGFSGNYGNFYHSSIYALSVYDSMTLNGVIDATAVQGDEIDLPPPFGTGELIQDSGTPVLMLGSNSTRVPYLNADLLDYYHAADLLESSNHTGNHTTLTVSGTTALNAGATVTGGALAVTRASGSAPRINIVASNTAGVTGDAPEFAFLDGTARVLLFTAAVNGVTRYAMIRAQTDRDGFRLPIRSYTDNAAGSLTLGMEVGAGAAAGNVGIGTTANSAYKLAVSGSTVMSGDLSVGSTSPSLGGGVKVLFIANATTVPTTNPVGGGLMYVEAGALKFRGSSGTVTTLAPA